MFNLATLEEADKDIVRIERELLNAQGKQMRELWQLNYGDIDDPKVKNDIKQTCRALLNNTSTIVVDNIGDLWKDRRVTVIERVGDIKDEGGTNE